MVLLQDNNIIFRIVTASDSDYQHHLDAGEGISVAEGFQASVGDYIDVSERNNPSVRPATAQDFIDHHGSASSIKGYELKQVLSDINISVESEEFQNSTEALDGNSVVDLSDDECFLYGISEQNRSKVYNCFGVIDVNEIKERNRKYLLVVEEEEIEEVVTEEVVADNTTTTTTEEVAAEETTEETTEAAE